MSQISKMYLSETSRMEMDIEYTAHYDAQLKPRGLDSQQSLLQTALNKKAFAMDISRELIDDGDSNDDDNESAQSPDYYSPAMGALPTSRIDVAKSVRDNMGRLHVLDGMSIPETQEAAVTAIMGQDLSIVLTKIDVKHPSTGEVIVRVAWTGMCRSVSFINPPIPRLNHLPVSNLTRKPPKKGCMFFSRSGAWIPVSQPHCRPRRDRKHRGQLRQVVAWPSGGHALSRIRLPIVQVLQARHLRIVP